MSRLITAFFVSLLCVVASAEVTPQMIDFGTFTVPQDVAVRPDGTTVIIGYRTVRGGIVDYYPSQPHALLWVVGQDGGLREIELPGLFEGAYCGGYCLSDKGLAAGGFSFTTERGYQTQVIWDLHDLENIPPAINVGITMTGESNSIGPITAVTDDLLKAAGYWGFLWTRPTAADEGSIEWLPGTPSSWPGMAVQGGSADLSVLAGFSSLTSWLSEAAVWRSGVTEALSKDPYEIDEASSVSPNGQIVGGGASYWYLDETGSTQVNILRPDGEYMNVYFRGLTDSGVGVGGESYLNDPVYVPRDSAEIAYPGFDPDHPDEVRGGNFTDWLESRYGLVPGDGEITDLLAVEHHGGVLNIVGYVRDIGPADPTTFWGVELINRGFYFQLPFGATNDPELVETDITNEVSITKSDSITSSTTQTNVRARISLRLFGRTFNIDFNAPVISGVTATNDAFVTVENTVAGAVTAPINMMVTPVDPEVTGGGIQALQTDGRFETGQVLAGGVVLTTAASYDLSSYLNRRLTLAEYAALVQSTNTWSQAQRQTVGQYEVTVTGLLPEAVTQP